VANDIEVPKVDPVKAPDCQRHRPYGARWETEMDLQNPTNSEDPRSGTP
jgi:hypothetical protein